MKRFLSWLVVIGCFIVYSIIARLLAVLVIIAAYKFLDMNLLAQLITVVVFGFGFISFFIYAAAFAAGQTVLWSEGVYPSRRGTRYVFIAAVIIIMSILEFLYLRNEKPFYVAVYELLYIAFAIMLMKRSSEIIGE